MPSLVVLNVLRLETRAGMVFGRLKRVPADLALGQPAASPMPGLRVALLERIRVAFVVRNRDGCLSGTVGIESGFPFCQNLLGFNHQTYGLGFLATSPLRL